MKILVLGGTGFIGLHLVRHLVKEGHDVAVFHRGEREGDIPACVTHIHGERKDLSKYARRFDAFGPRVSVDLTSFRESDARSVTETLRGRTDRLVCVSSMDVYHAYGCFRRLETGEAGLPPFGEETPLRTVLYPYRDEASGTEDFLYTYEKLLVEAVVMNQDRLPATVLRLPQVFGPHDRQHRLGGYLQQMDAGADITLSEEKARWRWTRGYVEDIASGIGLAAVSAKAAGRVYNIGEKEAKTEAEWVEQIGREAGWRGKIRTVPMAALPADLREPYDWNHDLAANTGRIRKEMGYHEVVSSEEAIRRTIKWERSARS